MLAALKLRQVSSYFLVSSLFHLQKKIFCLYLSILFGFILFSSFVASLWYMTCGMSTNWCKVILFLQQRSKLIHFVLLFQIRELSCPFLVCLDPFMLFSTNKLTFNMVQNYQLLCGLVLEHICFPFLLFWRMWNIVASLVCGSI